MVQAEEDDGLSIYTLVTTLHDHLACSFPVLNMPYDSWREKGKQGKRYKSYLRDKRSLGRRETKEGQWSLDTDEKDAVASDASHWLDSAHRISGCTPLLSPHWSLAIRLNDM